MPTVGQSIPYDSAPGHVTGEALFIDDISPAAGELWVEVVGAPCANGAIRRIDASAARAMDGVVAVLTHQDVPGRNAWGPIFHDEPVLASERVSYLGQPVALIAARSREVARAARTSVIVECAAEKPVLTIEEAIAAGSYLAGPVKIERGDVETALRGAPRMLGGMFECNGQEQFYLESQACIAYPGEGGALKVHSSTQNPTETQIVLASVLGRHMNQVVCECTRMGGGFGGKETQSVLPACFAALVAAKTGRAARVIYTKDDDMLITGKRHGYRVAHRVGFDDDGRVLALDFEFVSNGGAYCDLSTSILERTLFHADNAYFIPHARFHGRIGRTNLPPNTAFRGFGGPQAVAAVESVIEDIAHALGKDACDIRRLNLYGPAPRDTTPYGQPVREHVLPEIVDQLRASSGYDARRLGVASFNSASRTHLKGLALTLVKFGISFTTKFLNQGNALVNLYEDGSAQVSTGGTEMGQGLSVKVRQLVADELGLSIERVRVMTTSTEKNANTSPTAASASTDLNGMAAVDACRQIKARLTSYAARLLGERGGLPASPGSVRFERDEVFDDRRPLHRIEIADLCHAARRERIDMGARGFYATPGLHFDRTTYKGNPFYYFTTGGAVAEVTIDRFTGDTVVDRVDVLMDIGQMINPGVDYGQMIGGFIQGMGWCTTEELRYDDKGLLLTHSPTTYKIPNISDTPAVFNVHTIENPHHRRNVRHSKAVGEPPLMLGISVWAAVKDALRSRANCGAVQLRLPATNEEVLMCLRRMRSREAVAAR
jgi:xanthine dehydrogenase large subunit